MCTTEHEQPRRGIARHLSREHHAHIHRQTRCARRVQLLCEELDLLTLEEEEDELDPVEVHQAGEAPGVLTVSVAAL